MSSSIRDENGIFKPSDFNPTVSLSSSTISASGEESRTAVFDDSQSAIAIPIEITQKTITSNQIGEEGLLIVEYSLHNNSVETITDLHLGLLHDFDLSDNDQLEYDPSLSLIYQQNNSDMFVGVVALKNLSSFKMFENLSGKKGFTNSELLTIMSDTANDIRDTITGDLMFMTSTNKFSLTSNESFDVAYAYVCGNTLNELYDNAVIAKQKYDITTDLNDNTLSLPKQFELFQNYPNPFNPTTKIQFNLAATSEIKLEVYNVLGQKVKTIADTKLSAGVHEYQWDATDDANQSVASGIYFYRLSNDEQFKTHKMTLLK